MTAKKHSPVDKIKKAEMETLSFFVQDDYVHVGNTGIKRHFTLDLPQKIFVTLDDPASSILSKVISVLMISIIAFSSAVFIASTIPSILVTPDECPDPACNDDPIICPQSEVCAPEPPYSMNVMETVCVVIFTVEYLIRVLTVGFVPPRLAGLVMDEEAEGDENENENMNDGDNLLEYMDNLLHALEEVKKTKAKQEKEARLAKERRRSSIFAPKSMSFNDIVPSVSTEDHHDVSASNRLRAVGHLAMFFGKKFQAEPTTNASHDHAATLHNDDIHIEHANKAWSDSHIPLTSQAIIELTKKTHSDANNASHSENKVEKPQEHDSSPHGESLQHHSHPYEHEHQHDHATDFGILGNILESNATHESPTKDETLPKQSPRVTINTNENLFIDIPPQHSPRIASLGTRDSTVPEDEPTFHRVQQVLLYCATVFNMIDLLAILPFYVQLFTSAGTSLSFIRILRLARVMRVFKLGKNMKGITALSKTVTQSIETLGFVSFFIALGIIFFGSVEYFLESGEFKVTEDYPRGAYLRDTGLNGWQESPFRSILTTMYWAVVTSVTVGYGDIVPLSIGGKIVAVLCMYFGVLLMALPITVIGNNFNRQYEVLQGNDQEDIVYQCLTELIQLIDDDSIALARNKSADEDFETKMSLVMTIVGNLDETKRSRISNKLSSQLNENRANIEEKRKLKRKRSLEGDVDNLEKILEALQRAG